jgi:hypothetical protein
MREQLVCAYICLYACMYLNLASAWTAGQKLLTLDIREAITVAARSKALNVFARSNTGIMGSNPTGGMNVCLRLFCVCVR